VFLQELIAGEDVVEKYGLDPKGDGYPDYEMHKIPNKFPGDGSLYECFFDRDNLSWMDWSRTVATFEIPKEMPYTSLSIPTQDSIRVKGLFNRLLACNYPVLVTGPTGTGKSVMINQELKERYQNDEYAYIALAFSAQTTAQQTQNIIDGKCFKLRRGYFVPQDNKKGIIFVDDLNMPKIETPGINATQPPIELLRQWMDYKGWFDILGEEKDFKNIVNFTFITAMSPPGAGKNAVTLRYIRHFNVIYVEPYSSDSLKTIFSTVMDWFFMQFEATPFVPTIKSLKEKIVSATISTYDLLAS
jgi:dynein heavy chain